MEDGKMFEGLLRINPIDKLIATEVMGWRLCHYGFWETEFGELDSESEWSPSDDTADAVTVLNKLRKEFGVGMYTEEGFNTEIVLYYDTAKNKSYDFPNGGHVANHKEIPMAICLAALKAYGIEVPTDD
jgi:hypothetical protein